MEFNGTFLATIITFIIFVFVMNKVLYAPIIGIMEERKNLIDTNYKSAKDNDAKTEELVQEKEEKLNVAKNDAREKYLETVSDFKSQKADIISKAQGEAKEELEHYKAELVSVSDDVKNSLKNSMNELANDIVEKVIGYRSEINGFDNEIVDDVLWDRSK